MQLWLTVIETDCAPEWPPTIDGQNWQVELTESITLQGCNYSMPFRTSPVYPATDDFRLPTLAGSTVYFLFCCFDPAFRALARLSTCDDPTVRSGLLFSVGLSSAVIVSSDPSVVEVVEGVVGGNLRGYEQWRVTNGRLESVSITTPPAVQFDAEKLTVAAYDSLTLAPRAIIDEFVSGIRLLVPKVAAHVPTELGTFFSLVERVNILVSEMGYASAPHGAPPESLGEYSEADFAEDPSIAASILHQNTDRLIQVNAALSYVTTQAISGAFPILERRSLIRRHSLLGVGSALLGLTRIARSIEDAFAHAALEEVIDNRAPRANPLPGLDAFPAYDSRAWGDHSFSRWDGDIAPRDHYPKLPYFSGRLGFRETEYTISAALQSLSAGAEPEWSLLTITHEIVHGHVRNLLSAILYGEPNLAPGAKWHEFYERFEAKALGHVVTNESLIDSIRTVLFAHTCMTRTHGSLTHSAGSRPIDPADRTVRTDFVLPSEERLWTILEHELRNISEILVHVLDLHYFYCSRLSAYVPLIWRSWSTVPQLKGDLRQYVLRTLLVIATKTRGTAYHRFHEARKLFQELVEPLARSDGDGATTINAALDFIADDVSCEALFYPFHASLMLVDMAHHIFTSTAIRGRLVGGDPHLSVRTDPVSFEDWFEYRLGPGFVDEEVVAPAAFVADRLARKLTIAREDALERDTAMLFLACCSQSAPGA